MNQPQTTQPFPQGGIAPGFPAQPPTGGGFPQPNQQQAQAPQNAPPQAQMQPPQHAPGFTPPPTAVPQSQMIPQPDGATGGAVQHQQPQVAEPLPPQTVVGLRHRKTGMVYDFSPTMAKSQEVYPIDAHGNEVFNVPGMPGAQQNASQPRDVGIAGFATSQEVNILRQEIESFRQELASVHRMASAAANGVT